jgi:hypothetical protein
MVSNSYGKNLDKTCIRLQSRKILSFGRIQKLGKRSGKVKNPNFSVHSRRSGNPECEAKLRNLATSVRHMYKWLLFRRRGQNQSGAEPHHT